MRNPIKWLRCVALLGNRGTSNITSTLYPALPSGIGILSGGRGNFTDCLLGAIMVILAPWAFISGLRPAPATAAAIMVKRLNILRKVVIKSAL